MGTLSSTSSGQCPTLPAISVCGPCRSPTRSCLRSCGSWCSGLAWLQEVTLVLALQRGTLLSYCGRYLPPGQCSQSAFCVSWKDCRRFCIRSGSIGSSFSQSFTPDRDIYLHLSHSVLF